MSFLAKVFEGVKTVYSEINPATLSGAIDVIVVQQKDGSFHCSPFHVRFGKIGVLRSKEKVVDIEINGEPVDIHMKLGESGEAFFVEEIPSAEECPSYLVTSPIPPEIEDENFSSTQEPFRTRASSESCAHEKVVKFHRQGETRSDGDVLLPSELETYNFDTGSRTSVLSQIKEVASEHVTVASVTETLVGIKSEEGLLPQETSAGAGESLRVFKAETVKSGDIQGPFKPIQEATGTAPADLETPKSVVKRRKKKRSTKKRNQRSRLKKNSASSSEEAGEPSPTNSETSEEIIVIDDDVEKESSPEVEDKEESREAEEPAEAGLQEPTMITDWSTLSRGGGKDFHFFSDTDMYSPNISRPGTPVVSDTEYEKQAASQERPSIAQSDQPSWHWGELPTTPRTTPMRPVVPTSQDKEVKENVVNGKQTVENKKDEQVHAQRSMLSSMFSLLRQDKKIRQDPLAAGGIYLDDVNLNDMDPEVAAIYFPNAMQDFRRQGLNYRGQQGDDDVESGRGHSLPHSPSSFTGYFNRAAGVDSDSEEGRHQCRTRPNFDVTMSLCGGLEELAEPPEDLFLQSMISFDDLVENPKVIDNPALVIRVGNKYFNRAAALPIIMSLVCFQRSLPQTAIDVLIQENMTKPREERKKLEQQKSRSWFIWGRGGETKKAESELPAAKRTEPERANDSGKEDSLKKTASSDDLMPKSQERSPVGTPKKEVPIEKSPVEAPVAPSTQDNPQESTQTSANETRTEKCRKSLRLSSEQIEKLNLMEGENEVVFSVTTAYQGTTRCRCYIFLWKWDDKVVISDIDGTITKSDVLGHILPMVGRDWAQSGVAQLFTKIYENGYRVLYLSARAIGQAQITRDYLKSLKQGDLALPLGPVLLNPTSLLNALHREVIEKKPEAFKIACLRDILSLFPSDSTPFYAGYGNRINDVWAYKAVGISSQRIFTINPKGELKRDYTEACNSSHSNYTHQSTFVDLVFPPVRGANCLEHSCSDYSQFNYWKEPVPDLDIEILQAIGGDKKKK